MFLYDYHNPQSEGGGQLYPLFTRVSSAHKIRATPSTSGTLDRPITCLNPPIIKNLHGRGDLMPTLEESHGRPITCLSPPTIKNLRGRGDHTPSLEGSHVRSTTCLSSPTTKNLRGGGISTQY